MIRNEWSAVAENVVKIGLKIVHVGWLGKSCGFVFQKNPCDHYVTIGLKIRHADHLGESCGFVFKPIHVIIMLGLTW